MRKTPLFAAALLGLLSAQSHAQVQGTALINLEAAQLLTAVGTAIPDGSLIQLLGDTTSTFGAPTASSFTGTDPNEVVLDSFAMDSSTVGVPGDFKLPITLTVQTSPTQPYTGSFMLLRWYPTLTTASTDPGAGTSFGQFRTSAVENSSNIAWVVPAASTNNNLNFITTSQGGTEPNSAGEANLLVAVPEVSSFGLPVVGAAGLLFWLRRRRAAMSAVRTEAA